MPRCSHIAQVAGRIPLTPVRNLFLASSSATDKVDSVKIDLYHVYDLGELKTFPLPESILKRGPQAAVRCNIWPKRKYNTNDTTQLTHFACLPAHPCNLHPPPNYIMKYFSTRGGETELSFEEVCSCGTICVTSPLTLQRQF